MTRPADDLCAICARRGETRTVKTTDPDGRTVTMTTACAGSVTCPGFVPGNIPRRRG